MNIDEFNSRVRSEVDILRKSYRDDNSAFLIWFLKNIFCLMVTQMLNDYQAKFKQ